MGAIVSFTRSLSEALVEKGIRVNAVAPGPVLTPLIPSTMPPEQVEKFGESVPIIRTCHLLGSSPKRQVMTTGNSTGVESLYPQ